MAGHSHWRSVKYTKALVDAKRSRVFSKLAREIEIAAREEKNPEMNPKLRVAIEKAKTARMPSENIERAIKRGAGELVGEKLEGFLFEAYGPAGIAIIIEGIADNKNRALAEIRQILSQNNGKLVGEGSVKWLFKKMGCLVLNSNLQDEEFKNKERLELTVIEAGAEDFYWHENVLDVYTKTEHLDKVKKKLEDEGIKIESISLDWVPKEMIEVDEKTKKECQKLFEALDENDAVQEIYSNLKI